MARVDLGLRGLAGASVFVTDMEAASSFYSGVLGFRRTGESGDGKIQSLGFGNLELTLRLVPNAIYSSVSFFVADLEAAVDAIDARGGRVESSGATTDVAGWGDYARWVLLRDPDGNGVCLLQKTAPYGDMSDEELFTDHEAARDAAATEQSRR